MIKKLLRWPLMAFTFGLLASGASFAAEEFDEFEPIIEMNATDGDIGFHVLLDGDAWKGASVFDGNVDRLILARASGSMRDQGITEFFIESDEPLCWLDPEEEDLDPEDVVTLEDFLERFPAGRYKAFGRDLDGELLTAAGRLTHNIPAAPAMDEDDLVYDAEANTVTITWQRGDDLGNCAIPEGMTLSRSLMRFEVVLEPEEDELPAGVVFQKFTAQVPRYVRKFVVPASYIKPLVDQGVTVFKGEVGAKEVSGNQVFTEIEIDIEE